jgi:hypothetical protein
LPRSLILEQLFEKVDRPSRVVAFIFCDHAQNLTINDLLGSLLRQLVLSLPLSPAVTKWWDGSREPLNTEKLEEMLISQIESASGGPISVDLLSDAFDECGARTRLLRTFQSLTQTNKVRVCITSRPNYPDVIQQSDCKIWVDSTVEDIRKFVVEQITDPKDDVFSDLHTLLQSAKPEGGQTFCDYVLPRLWRELVQGK